MALAESGNFYFLFFIFICHITEYSTNLMYYYLMMIIQYL